MDQPATPTPRIRPQVPQPGTRTYARWAEDAALSYKGGSITAAYGNLTQTWIESKIAGSCVTDSKTVNVKASSPVLTIGGAPTTRRSYTFTKKQYTKQNSSQAAGGEPIVIVTDLGEYQARLNGSMQDFLSWVCEYREALHGTIYIYSPRGAEYGPFSPTIV